MRPGCLQGQNGILQPSLMTVFEFPLMFKFYVVVYQQYNPGTVWWRGCLGLEGALSCLNMNNGPMFTWPCKPAQISPIWCLSKCTWNWFSAIYSALRLSRKDGWGTRQLWKLSTFTQVLYFSSILRCLLLLSRGGKGTGKQRCFPESNL